jgi:hypothetical protein
VNLNDKIKKQVINNHISLCIIMVSLCFSSGMAFNNGYSEIRNQPLNDSITIQDEKSLSIWRLIEVAQPDTLELKIDIFGYSIISTDVNPLDYDEHGQLILKS